MPLQSSATARGLNGSGSNQPDPAWLLGLSLVSQSCYKVEGDARLRVRPNRRNLPIRGRASVRPRPVGWPTAAMSQHAIRSSDPAAALRFLDVGLIILALPFVVVADLPVLGYAVGAGAWIVQRIAGELVERRARGAEDPRTAIGLTVASIIARAWVVGLAIVAVGTAGSREDGAMAAATVLAAFSIYFAMNVLLRSLERGAR